MRDYDEYGEYVDEGIRLHTPILQRVIILAAVIIAVPVVMWTITAFVRSYVARPKVPALQHVASTEIPAAARLGTKAPATVPPIANPPAPPPRADTPVQSPSADAPSPPAGVQSSSIQPPLAPPAGRPANAGAETSPTGSTTPNTAAPAAGPMLRGADNVGATAALSGPTSGAPAGDRGLAWPNPNSTTAPSFGSAIAPAAPAPSAAPPRMAAIESLPPTEPIRGAIPLPRHRPAVIATAAGGPTGGASSGPTSGTRSGPVPLPRGRPSGAPAETSQPLTHPGGYEPGLSAGGG
jgi:hypothetical protein